MYFSIRNLFVSNGSNGLHRNDFLPPYPTLSGIFLSLLRIEEMNFSIGIYSCPMDHLHFTTTLPVFRWKARGYDWSLVNGYWTTLRKVEKEEALQKVGKRSLKEPESRLFYLHFISMKEIPQISRIKNSSRYL